MRTERNTAPEEGRQDSVFTGGGPGTGQADLPAPAEDGLVGVPDRDIYGARETVRLVEAAGAKRWAPRYARRCTGSGPCQGVVVGVCPGSRRSLSGATGLRLSVPVQRPDAVHSNDMTGRSCVPEKFALLPHPGSVQRCRADRWCGTVTRHPTADGGVPAVSAATGWHLAQCPRSDVRPSFVARSSSSSDESRSLRQLPRPPLARRNWADAFLMFTVLLLPASTPAGL